MLIKSNHEFLQKNQTSFWGRIARRLISAAIVVINTVPIIGPLVADELGDQLGGYLQQRGGAPIPGELQPYEPTDAEDGIMSAWMEAKFKPFVTTMLQELRVAVASSNFVTQLNGINKASAKMQMVGDYYRGLAAPGLSSQALYYRSNIINGMFDSVRTVIEDILEKNTTKFLVTVENVVSNPGEIHPLSMNVATYPCIKYRFIQTLLPGAIEPVIPAQIPPILIPTQSPTFIDSTVSDNEGISANENSLPKTASSKNQVTQIVSTVVVGALLFFWLLPKDQAEKK